MLKTQKGKQKRYSNRIKFPIKCLRISNAGLRRECLKKIHNLRHNPHLEHRRTVQIKIVQVFFAAEQKKYVKLMSNLLFLHEL
mmetsp:Transcript_5326/g.12973  ORF Transcript_5326/g.12973 Transcript_5326/m.12973 type:complete len:83 (-) Transcript_5326:33-281(-)